MFEIARLILPYVGYAVAVMLMATYIFAVTYLNCEENALQKILTEEPTRSVVATPAMRTLDRGEIEVALVKIDELRGKLLWFVVGAVTVAGLSALIQ